MMLNFYNLSKVIKDVKLLNLFYNNFNLKYSLISKKVKDVRLPNLFGNNN